jgi:hypothetical protein
MIDRILMMRRVHNGFQWHEMCEFAAVATIVQLFLRPKQLNCEPMMPIKMVFLLASVHTTHSMLRVQGIKR